MDPFLLQWRLYNHNIRNAKLWFIKYNVYADQHRHVTKKTTDSSYVNYDCRVATVGERRSMAWMPAYIAVPNLLSMISMVISLFYPFSVLCHHPLFYPLCPLISASLLYSPYSLSSTSPPPPPSVVLPSDLFRVS
jgi:hypothetical protein